MRTLISSLIIVMLVFSLSLAFTPGEARKAIESMGIEYTPESFVKAATEGNTKAVEMFLAAGMDPDVEANGTRAILESSCGEIDIVRLLINAGAEVNVAKKGGGTPLEEAANARSPEIVRLLLSNGADPNLGSPLSMARKRNSREIMDILIKAGARE